MWLLGERLCRSRYPCFNRWVSASRGSFLPRGAAPGCAGTYCGVQPRGELVCSMPRVALRGFCCCPMEATLQGAATVGQQGIIVGDPWLVLPGGFVELLPPSWPRSRVLPLR